MEKILLKTEQATSQGQYTLEELFPAVELLTLLAEIDIEQRVKQQYKKEVGNKSNEDNRS